MHTKRKSQTPSTKCQYQAAASKPKWWSRGCGHQQPRERRPHHNRRPSRGLDVSPPGSFHALIFRPLSQHRPQPFLFLLTGCVELVEVGPEIGGVALALDAGEDHLGAGHVGLGIRDVGLEGALTTSKAGLLVCVAVA